MKEITANKTRSFLLDYINHEMTQKMKEKDQTKLNHKTSKQIISEYDNYEVHIENELVTYRSPNYKNRKRTHIKDKNSNISNRKTSLSNNSETCLQRKERKNLSQNNLTSTDFYMILLPINHTNDLQNPKDSFRLHSKSLRHTAFKLKHLVSNKQTK